ncbi:hypothetical protein skT53_33810 [Effusibacillus dendaii]|uniref:O-methyltransferase n=1 Tax=Effusibacillus dendaii TaxID=2743772 RepID=A0A7I8DHK8_9BACL|nr:hypothetical protein skT53_33810 [Effusibacillus dendaii]
MASLEGPWDFVFIDAVKEEYIFYLAMVWPKLRSGGLIVADNMLSHKGILGITAYQGFVRLQDDGATVTVPSDQAMSSLVNISGGLTRPLNSERKRGKQFWGESGRSIGRAIS